MTLTSVRSIIRTNREPRPGMRDTEHVRTLGDLMMTDTRSDAISDLFHHAGVEHPRELTESAVLAWCGSFRANNTVRNRLSRACTFLRWCVRQGYA